MSDVALQETVYMTIFTALGQTKYITPKSRMEAAVGVIDSTGSEGHAAGDRLNVSGTFTAFKESHIMTVEFHCWLACYHGHTQWVPLYVQISSGDTFIGSFKCETKRGFLELEPFSPDFIAAALALPLMPPLTV